MKIYQKAQSVPGGKKFKLVISLDFLNGGGSLGFKDHQFGAKGGPCKAVLAQLVKGLQDAEPAVPSTAGYSDKDTSGVPPEGEKQLRNTEEDIILPEQQQERAQ